MPNVDQEWEAFRSTLHSMQKATSLREQLNVISAQLNEIEQDTKDIQKIKEELLADDNAESAIEQDPTLAPQDPNAAIMGGAMGGGMPPGMPPMDPGMMGGGMPPGMPPGMPMDPNMMKSDLSAEGESPIAEAVGLTEGSDKVQALFNQLIDALSDEAHMSLDAGDIARLMKLTNVQSNLTSLLNEVLPLAASLPLNELGGGEPIAKSGRNFGNGLLYFPGSKATRILSDTDDEGAYVGDLDKAIALARAASKDAGLLSGGQSYGWDSQVDHLLRYLTHNIHALQNPGIYANGLGKLTGAADDLPLLLLKKHFPGSVDPLLQTYSDYRAAHPDAKDYDIGTLLAANVYAAEHGLELEDMLESNHTGRGVSVDMVAQHRPFVARVLKDVMYKLDYYDKNGMFPTEGGKVKSDDAEVDRANPLSIFGSSQAKVAARRRLSFKDSQLPEEHIPFTQRVSAKKYIDAGGLFPDLGNRLRLDDNRDIDPDAIRVMVMEALKRGVSEDEIPDDPQELADILGYPHDYFLKPAATVQDATRDAHIQRHQKMVQDAAKNVTGPRREFRAAQEEYNEARMAQNNIQILENQWNRAKKEVVDLRAKGDHIGANEKNKEAEEIRKQIEALRHKNYFMDEYKSRYDAAKKKLDEVSSVRNAAKDVLSIERGRPTAALAELMRQHVGGYGLQEMISHPELFALQAGNVHQKPGPVEDVEPLKLPKVLQDAAGRSPEFAHVFDFDESEGGFLGPMASMLMDKELMGKRSQIPQLSDDEARVLSEYREDHDAFSERNKEMIRAGRKSGALPAAPDLPMFIRNTNLYKENRRKYLEHDPGYDPDLFKYSRSGFDPRTMALLAKENPDVHIFADLFKQLVLEPYYKDRDEKVKEFRRSYVDPKTGKRVVKPGYASLPPALRDKLAPIEKFIDPGSEDFDLGALDELFNIQDLHKFLGDMTPEDVEKLVDEVGGFSDKLGARPEVVKDILKRKKKEAQKVGLYDPKFTPHAKVFNGEDYDELPNVGGFALSSMIDKGLPDLGLPGLTTTSSEDISRWIAEATSQKGDIEAQIEAMYGGPRSDEELGTELQSLKDSLEEKESALARAQVAMSSKKLPESGATPSQKRAYTIAKKRFEAAREDYTQTLERAQTIQRLMGRSSLDTRISKLKEQAKTLSTPTAVQQKAMNELGSYKGYIDLPESEYLKLMALAQAIGRDGGLKKLRANPAYVLDPERTASGLTTELPFVADDEEDTDYLTVNGTRIPSPYAFSVDEVPIPIPSAEHDVLQHRADLHDKAARGEKLTRAERKEAGKALTPEEMEALEMGRFHNGMLETLGYKVHEVMDKDGNVVGHVPTISYGEQKKKDENGKPIRPEDLEDPTVRTERMHRVKISPGRGFNLATGDVDFPLFAGPGNESTAYTWNSPELSTLMYLLYPDPRAREIFARLARTVQGGALDTLPEGAKGTSPRTIAALDRQKGEYTNPAVVAAAMQLGQDGLMPFIREGTSYTGTDAQTDNTYASNAADSIAEAALGINMTPGQSRYFSAEGYLGDVLQFLGADKTNPRSDKEMGVGFESPETADEIRDYALREGLKAWAHNAAVPTFNGRADDDFFGRMDALISLGGPMEYKNEKGDFILMPRGEYKKFADYVEKKKAKGGKTNDGKEVTLELPDYDTYVQDVAFALLDKPEKTSAPKEPKEENAAGAPDATPTTPDSTPEAGTVQDKAAEAESVVSEAQDKAPAKRSGPKGGIIMSRKR